MISAYEAAYFGNEWFSTYGSAEEYVNAFVNGEKEAVASALIDPWELRELAEYEGTDGENVGDKFYSYTPEQMKYILYSLFGRQMEPAWLSNGENTNIYFSGDVPLVRMRGYNTEYLGSNTWKISVEGCSPDYPDSKMCDAVFTVTRNPDSCFDGYSITGVEVIPTDNSGWAQAYYNYLMGGYMDPDFDEWGEFGLYYINEDNIPELVAIEPGLQTILTILNGQVVDLSAGNLGGSMSGISFVERANRVLFVNRFDADYAFGHVVYEIINGSLHEIASGVVYPKETTDPEYFDYNVPPNEWNGREVSEEEFYALLDEVFDTTRETDPWNDAVDFNTMIYTLQDIINNG